MHGHEFKANYMKSSSFSGAKQNAKAFQQNTTKHKNQTGRTFNNRVEMLQPSGNPFQNHAGQKKTRFGLTRVVLVDKKK